MATPSTPQSAPIEIPMPALPRLELNITSKSQETFTPGNGRVETRNRWGGHHIGLIEGSSEIEIIGPPNGTRDQGLKTQNNAEPSIIHPTPIPLQMPAGKSYIVINDNCSHRNSDACNITQAANITGDLKKNYDIQITGGATACCVQHNQVTLRRKLQLRPNSTISISPNGKYIVIHAGDRWIAFNTHGTGTKSQAPDAWERIDIGKKTLPEINANTELIQFLGTLNAAEAVITVRLNDTQVAKTTPKTVQIAPANNPANVSATFNIAGVGKNVCADPKNPAIIYVCPENNQQGEMFVINMSGAAPTWQPKKIPNFPKKHKKIYGIHFDPTGNLMVLETATSTVILEKGSWEEIQLKPPVRSLQFETDGKITAVDTTGHIVICNNNMTTILPILEQRRIARTAQGVGAAGTAAQIGPKKTSPQFEKLKPIRDLTGQKITAAIKPATTMSAVDAAAQLITQIRGQLTGEGYQPPEIEFILQPGFEAIKAKKQEIAGTLVQGVITRVRTNLGGVSIAVLPQLTADIKTLVDLYVNVTPTVRTEIEAVSDEFRVKSTQLFEQQGKTIIKTIDGIIQGVATALQGIHRALALRKWEEDELPKVREQLRALETACPLGATDAHAKIIAAQQELIRIVSNQRQKLTKDEKAETARARANIDDFDQLIKTEIDEWVQYLRDQRFPTRTAAQTTIDTSATRRHLEAQIASLKTKDTEAGAATELKLKIAIANLLGEIDRGGLEVVDATGKKSVRFGTRTFPKWEGHVETRRKKEMNIIFMEDPRTKGPGVKVEEIRGDIGVEVTYGYDKKKTRRLFEGMEDEEDWRYNTMHWRGGGITPSYVDPATHRTVKTNYRDWSRGDESKLKKSIAAIQEKINTHKTKRPKPPVGTTGKEKIKTWRETDTKYKTWKEEGKTLIKELADFYEKNHILLLRRLERIEMEEEETNGNGTGYVPEWKNDWVRDEHTEKYLGKMAGRCKMQLELQKGMLLLKGHAGTGKDVLVEMFASATGRPLFGFNCSKWTTEFELAEDVQLEAEGGASRTIKVPSTILQGITTPGAIVYLNEFNAMPEQAQIFLHALLDGKRSMTLKTSSGKVVKAEPSVVIMGSMNPGSRLYPGTFDPQLATRSRLVELNIEYPPYQYKKNPADKTPFNNKDPYDVSEALRIARSVPSLKELTFDPNMKTNEFVKVWDQHVNSYPSTPPARTLNPTQQFDLMVLLALVQFTHRLREEFKKQGLDAKALPVKFPVTGRELQFCAYRLGEMPDNEKIVTPGKPAPDPATVARNLLANYFLVHSDDDVEREKIETAMRSWSSTKRVP